MHNLFKNQIIRAGLHVYKSAFRMHLSEMHINVNVNSTVDTKLCIKTYTKSNVVAHDNSCYLILIDMVCHVYCHSLPCVLPYEI